MKKLELTRRTPEETPTKPGVVDWRMAITELGKVNDLYKRAKCGGGYDLMVTALQRVEHGGDGKMSRQAMEMDEVASDGLGDTYPLLCTRG